MTFQPIPEWWLGLIVFAIAQAIIGYNLWLTRKKARKAMLPWLRRAGLFVFILVAILGPSIPITSSSPGVGNLDVLFVVDTTASMGATDYAGKALRIEGVRRDMLALGEKLQGAYFSIITFDSKAYPILPFTDDYATFTGTVGILERELYSTSKGSNIDMPISLATKQLKNRHTLYPKRAMLIFYLGDGEQTNTATVKKFSSIQTYVSGGAVLGYGTAQGSTMLKYTGSQESTTELIKTMDSNTKQVINAISKIDEQNLKGIAAELKIPYKNRNQPEDISSLMQESGTNTLIQKGKDVTLYSNLYWLSMIIAGGLLFWEWRTIIIELISVSASRDKKRKEIARKQ